MSDCNEKPRKIKNLKVKNLCVLNSGEKNSQIQNLTADNLTAQDANINNLTVQGINMNCLLSQPFSTNSPSNIDTVIGPTGPIKPTNVDQQVWDCLISNAEYELNGPNGLQERVTRGRNKIANYTYLPAVFTARIEGTTLIVTELQSGELSKGRIIEGDNVLPGTKIVAKTDEDGKFEINFDQNVDEEEMTSPARCPQPCPFEPDAPNQIEIYGYKTVPIFTQNPCNVGATGTDYVSFVKNMSFNLDVYYQIEQTESAEARLISVMCQVGYIDPSGPTGCASAFCEESNVVIYTVYIGNKQFYPTLDDEYGENFSATLSVPSDIIQKAFEAMPDPNRTGAVQLVFYREPGICIWTPAGECGFECRKGEPDPGNAGTNVESQSGMCCA